MDAEDHGRALSNKQKLLLALQRRGVLTNHEARALAGSRAMGRCHELIQEGYPITVRKLKGATWEIRYAQPPLGRDAQTRKAVRPRKSPQTESLFQL